jgi:hypothetical protein
MLSKYLRRLRGFVEHERLRRHALVTLARCTYTIVNVEEEHRLFIFVCHFVVGVEYEWEGVMGVLEEVTVRLGLVPWRIYILRRAPVLFSLLACRSIHPSSSTPTQRRTLLAFVLYIATV